MPIHHRGVIFAQTLQGALGFCVLTLDRYVELQSVFGVLLDEGDKALQRAVTLVVDEFASTSWLELDGGEARYTEGKRGGKIILLGLDFGTADRRFSKIDPSVDG